MGYAAFSNPMQRNPPFPLPAYATWWLDTRCCCGRVVQTPVRLLLRRHGRHADAGDLARRLRCTVCGERPASAELVDDPGAIGMGLNPVDRRRRVLVLG